eukprot:GHVR01127201.1.p3 GENE.GHVR01127201.1~~GHVR01127201.1.p3  ORF type:complete len:101 (+),score=7.22 GHVR01127201.1:443-745(+)
MRQYRHAADCADEGQLRDDGLQHRAIPDEQQPQPALWWANDHGALTPKSLVVSSIAMANFAAEHSILHRVVDQDDGQHDQSSNQRKYLAFRARRGGPDAQ